MTPEELLNRISALSSEQQNAVEEFVAFLHKKKTPAPIDARAVIDTFMNEHAELMRVLAR